VQSFDADVLLRSRRGHGPEAVHQAARLVREAGLGLGVQLLPGLPGMDERIFKRDVRQAVALEPDCARLYPLQVLQGTELARMWREGRYAVWGLEETIERLGLALDAFWREGIRVIRVGLAPEPALEAGVLAGPRHPAMGQLAKGRALYLTVKRQVRALGRTPESFSVPARWFSDVVGHQGRMLPLYAALGLSREKIVRAEGRFFELS
jgi:histone acetyltransferase (RNA polymerase elongator complex component)